VLDKWLKPLSPTARELLLVERAHTADPALKERALQRAEAALAGERWSGILPTHEPSHRSSWVGSRLVRGGLLLAAVLGFAGLSLAGMRWVVGPAAVGSDATAAPAPSVGATARHPLPRPVLEPELGTAAEATPVSSVPAGHASAPARPSGVKQYAIELGLLEPARSSVARGDYGAALDVIARHRREYPHGQLAEERDALRVRALWGLGQRSTARTAAASFRRRYPTSTLLSWLKEEP
jgi:hypothetical protein